MAATDAIPVPRKNTAFRFYFAIRKPADSTLVTTWAGQDSEVSLDGGSYADCTNEATEIGTSGTGYIDLTAAEMNADCVLLKVSVTNSGSVPLVFVFYPESAGDYRVDLVQIAGDAQSATDLKDFADAGYDPSTNTVTAALDSAVGTQITNIENASGYLLAVLAGECADPQTASETYAITVFGSTFTVDMAGQTSTGTRTAPTLTKA